MTATEAVPPPPAITPVVQPETDSRLEQLLAQFDSAKAEFDEAKKRFEALKNEIKVEAAAAAPGARKLRISSPYLDRTLEMSYRTNWKLDSTRLKAEEPRVWVEYAYESGSWYLQAAR